MLCFCLFSNLSSLTKHLWHFFFSANNKQQLFEVFLFSLMSSASSCDTFSSQQRVNKKIVILLYFLSLISVWNICCIFSKQTVNINQSWFDTFFSTYNFFNHLLHFFSVNCKQMPRDGSETTNCWYFLKITTILQKWPW